MDNGLTDLRTYGLTDLRTYGQINIEIHCFNF
jgi:hypothetical protein